MRKLTVAIALVSVLSSCTLSAKLPIEGLSGSPSATKSATDSSDSAAPSFSAPTAIQIGIVQQFQSTDKYDLNYPEFTVVADETESVLPFVDQLNRRMEAAVAHCLNFSKRKQFGHDQTICDFKAEVKYSKPQLVLVRFELFTMLAGGAHGTTEVATHGFSPETGKSVTLWNELTPEGKQAIAAAALQFLRDNERYYDDEWFISAADRDAILQKPSTWQSWWPDSGLRVQFPEYVVGPYAIGMPEVWFSDQEIAGWLRSDSPLAKVFGS